MGKKQTLTSTVVAAYCYNVKFESILSIANVNKQLTGNSNRNSVFLLRKQQLVVTGTVLPKAKQSCTKTSAAGDSAIAFYLQIFR